MKFNSLTRWDLGPATEGVLYLAQRLQEMLLHYTLDGFQASVMDSRLLCNEARLLLREAEDGSVPHRALQPVLDELGLSLSGDTVARALVGDTFDDYCKSLGHWSPGASTRQLNTSLATLSELLSGQDYSRYYRQTVVQLAAVCVDGRQKARIDRLLDQAVCELRALGYSRDYVYYQTVRYFFDPTNRAAGRITGAANVTAFFATFDFSSQQYKVVLHGSEEFSAITEAARSFGVRIQKTFSARTRRTEESDFLKAKKSNQVFLVIETPPVDAGPALMSPQDARSYADAIIGKLANLLSYVHHANRPVWSEGALVYDGDYVVFLRHSPEAIRKRDDMRLDQADEALIRSIGSLLRLAPASFGKFNSAIDLHGAAIESASSENRLLDLWALTETLIPVRKGRGSRIEQVCSQMRPLLRNAYLYGVLDYLYRDLLLSWGRTQTRNTLRAIQEGSNELEKLAILIGAQSYEPTLSGVLADMDEFPLIRQRLFVLNKWFTSGDEVSRALDAYCMRVDWQLQRIYRARNSIVHAGRTPHTIDLLIRSLHSYVDVLLSAVEGYVTQERHISSIESMLHDAEMLDRGRMAGLAAIGGDRLDVTTAPGAVLGEPAIRGLVHRRQ